IHFHGVQGFPTNLTEAVDDEGKAGTVGLELGPGGTKATVEVRGTDLSPMGIMPGPEGFPGSRGESQKSGDLHESLDLRILGIIEDLLGKVEVPETGDCRDPTLADCEVHIGIKVEVGGRIALGHGEQQAGQESVLTTSGISEIGE